MAVPVHHGIAVRPAVRRVNRAAVVGLLVRVGVARRAGLEAGDVGAELSALVLDVAVVAADARLRVRRCDSRLEANLSHW